MIVYIGLVCGFFIAFILLNGTLLVLAWAELRRYRARSNSTALRRALRSPLAPPIANLVSAYNEASGIADSVRSLLALNYPRIEVVVINDGSADYTLLRLVEVFDSRGRCRGPPRRSWCSARCGGGARPRGGSCCCWCRSSRGAGRPSRRTRASTSAPARWCWFGGRRLDPGAGRAGPGGAAVHRGPAAHGGYRLARCGSPTTCIIEHGRVTNALRCPKAQCGHHPARRAHTAGVFGARTWVDIDLAATGAADRVRRVRPVPAGRGHHRGRLPGPTPWSRTWNWWCGCTGPAAGPGRPYRIVYVPDPVCWTEAPESCASCACSGAAGSAGSVERRRRPGPAQPP